ncbi:glycosyltransferase family 4 protein [Mycobacterium sp. URHB0044]|jgi:glycosyltransferase involved in cell wall biosynthesis|uniref:glycosyltransferase family 4 protein n=1 Tax=Mycobacterium sp. URHB0044 TaxID=1380386 RepID=UPI00048DE154|nr:glycosyltransferase family 4 protein [Mycobacterium sp. URHB0044]
MTALRILVVGPAPAGPISRGGMATVVSLMAAHPDPRFEVTVVPTYVDGSTWLRLSVGVRGMARAAGSIFRGKVDVLHVHLSHGGSIVRKAVPLWAARLAGIPAVVHGHSFDFGGWFDDRSVLTQHLVRAALPAEHWLVLGSSHAEEYAQRLKIAADRISVLHNAIQVPLQAVDQGRADPVHAVALGRLGERKGSYDLITAVQQLQPDVRRRLRVTIAGDGEIDAVTAAVEAAGVDDTVHVAGWLDTRQRDQLLSRAHVFLLPSRDEGLPMALLEAMGCGLAPLTTAVGSIGEVITDDLNGLLVAPGRPDQIACALSTLVVDEKRRTRLASAARDHVGGFTVNRWYERLAALWTVMASQPAPPSRSESLARAD